jgi:DNA polymerase-3 subunit alpha
MYINKAKECGMTALAFSEHGNILNWYEKKSKIEKAGMKYVHAMEAYVTETLDEAIRDNYHFVLIAKNYDGFLELNRLNTKSYNRHDNSFYYRPRISLDDIMNTSDNIIITTACLAGLLNSQKDELKERFINWAITHKDRVFLEIQHHNVSEQISYNKNLYILSQKTGLRLIAGTDTHSIDEPHAEARVIMQKAKGVYFDNEDGWDLTFKTYDELVESYRKQNSLPMDMVIEAIKTTKIVEDMIEPFELDMSTKYPKLYDNSLEVFRKMVYDSIDTHPYALKFHTKEEIIKRIEEELPVYEKTHMIDFMLFQKFVRDWEHENNIYVGAGRGSVSGSYIAYLLGITEMDSIRFDLNFFRFANEYRVSNCDIDSDYYDPDRVKTRNFLLTCDKIKSAEIAAFGTIKLRGAIRDIGRALELSLDEVTEICDKLEEVETNGKKVEVAGEALRKKYPELFKYVDLVQDVIVSVGTHPAGVLCASRPIDEEIGLFSLSTTEHMVSCNDMYGLDACWWTKLDCLGLDNVGIINKTCELAGIERINPDNIDLEDWEVWDDIRQDTTAVFQMESPYAAQTMKQIFSDSTIAKIRKAIPNIKMLKLMSYANALIRPCGASVREDSVNGIIKKTGINDIDDLLAPELGNCIIQEDIMLFLMKFCGFDLPRADYARKCIAKKKGTEQLMPEIEEGFNNNAKVKYNLSNEKADEIIKPVLKCILDATRYAFSWNHSDAYSFIGYGCGYLRHYYPLEFLTTCLNVWQDKTDKTAMVTSKIAERGYKIANAKFRMSRAEYFCDKSTGTIYKGIKSIKYLNENVAEILYSFKDNKYNSFVELLCDISKTSINSRQMGVLIDIDFFEEFGTAKQLVLIYNIFNMFKQGNAKLIKKEKLSNNPILNNIVIRYSKETATNYTQLDCKNILSEAEQYIMCSITDDYPIGYKIKVRKEYLGYIDYKTNKPEDRPKILIQSLKKCIGKFGKDTGKPWCYMLEGYSLGSGKVSTYSIFTKQFEKTPFAVDDVIYIDEWHRNNKGYFYIDKYKILPKI